jgi:diguanylate cyclase (GGDEF)-like protein
LRRAAIMAAPVGLVAGMWAANAFSHATHDYCMVAPVFIAIAALTSASCLLGVPRAAIAGMVASIAPIAVKLALYDSWGMRALALMLVLMTAMQIHVVLDKFKETLAMLEQKHQAVRASLTDPLTGLDNRLAFMRMLEERLRLDRPVMLVLADLDGLKIANDTHGHLAGDAILTETARRMKRLGARALCVARLGGDEFAMLYDVARGQKLALGEIAAIRASLSLPIVWNDRIVSIGASFGTAIGPLEGASPAAIINPPTPASMPTKPRARTPCRVLPRSGCGGPFWLICLRRAKGLVPCNPVTVLVARQLPCCAWVRNGCYLKPLRGVGMSEKSGERTSGPDLNLDAVRNQRPNFFDLSISHRDAPTRQSSFLCSPPSQPKPLRMPWIMTSPPGSTPSR